MSDHSGENGVVVVFGDGASGKTCLLQQYIDGRFEHRYKASVGLDVQSKTVAVGSRTVSLNFFDFAGQERFAVSAPHVIKKAHCFVLTFDVSSRKSFFGLEHWWARSLPYCTAAHVVVGTKTDVTEHQVSEEEVESWCREHGGIPHVLVSAKTNANVDEAFDAIARLVLARLDSSADDTIAYGDQPGAAACSHIGTDDLASRVEGALPSALLGAGREDGGVMSMVAVGSDEESDDGLLKFCRDEGDWVGRTNSGTVADAAKGWQRAAEHSRDRDQEWRAPSWTQPSSSSTMGGGRRRVDCVVAAMTSGSHEEDENGEDGGSLPYVDMAARADTGDIERVELELRRAAGAIKKGTLAELDEIMLSQPSLGDLFERQEMLAAPSIRLDGRANRAKLGEQDAGSGMACTVNGEHVKDVVEGPEIEGGRYFSFATSYEDADVGEGTPLLRPLPARTPPSRSYERHGNGDLENLRAISTALDSLPQSAQTLLLRQQLLELYELTIDLEGLHSQSVGVDMGDIDAASSSSGGSSIPPRSDDLVRAYHADKQRYEDLKRRLDRKKKLRRLPAPDFRGRGNPWGCLVEESRSERAWRRGREWRGSDRRAEEEEQEAAFLLFTSYDGPSLLPLLPQELLTIVCQHLSRHDVLMLASTCKCMRSMCTADDVWGRFVVVSLRDNRRHLFRRTIVLKREQRERREHDRLRASWRHQSLVDTAVPMQALSLWCLHCGGEGSGCGRTCGTLGQRWFRAFAGCDRGDPCRWLQLLDCCGAPLRCCIALPLVCCECYGGADVPFREVANECRRGTGVVLGSALFLVAPLYVVLCVWVLMEGQFALFASILLIATALAVCTACTACAFGWCIKCELCHTPMY